MPNDVFGINKRSTLIRIDRFWSFNLTLEAIFTEIVRRNRQRLLSEEKIKELHRYCAGLDEIEHIEQKLWSLTNK